MSYPGGSYPPGQPGYPPSPTPYPNTQPYPAGPPYGMPAVPGYPPSPAPGYPPVQPGYPSTGYPPVAPYPVPGTQPYPTGPPPGGYPAGYTPMPPLLLQPVPAVYPNRSPRSSPCPSPRPSPPPGGRATPPPGHSRSTPPPGHGRYTPPPGGRYTPPPGGRYTPPPGGRYTPPPGHGRSTPPPGRYRPAPLPPETEGTLKRYPIFNVEADAAQIRKAMKGLGTDGKGIINIIAYRSNAQRMEIKAKFKTVYGRDLSKDFKSELSGNFGQVCRALLMTPPEYDAFVLREAMKGAGTDERALAEVLCTRTNWQILEIKEQYKTDYGRDLEKDVMSDTSGHFKRLLVSMLTAARDPDGPVDKEKARTDAQKLYQAGEARWGTDESQFNHILANRSYSHLRAVFEEYSKVCKYDIEQSIAREMSGDLKQGMLTIVKCVRDRPGYFAEALYKSMKGLGTDDRSLIRVVVSRCEIDMVQIKQTFVLRYHKTLGSFIKGDTSGDYRRILMALTKED